MTKKLFITSILILLMVLAFGCKSSKTLVSGKANFSLSEKQLISENIKRTPIFKTLASRVKVDVVNGTQEQSYTINLRIEKDKKILLMSTPISVVKALITPQRVSFYNKLDNTYFDGDYSYLSKMLGTELDFQKVQNLLLGEAIYNLNVSDYDMTTNEKSYILQPKFSNELLEIFFLLNPSHFKLESQQLAQATDSRFLQIDYLAYQKIKRQTLPERIKIIALDARNEMILDMEFKSVSLNEKLRFPFKIPSGYHEIILK